MSDLPFDDSSVAPVADIGEARNKKRREKRPRPQFDQRIDGLDLSMSEKGEILATRANAVDILASAPDWKGVFGHDDMIERDVFVEPPPFSIKTGPICDSDIGRIATWLERSNYHVKFRSNSDDLASAVVELCSRNRINKARDEIAAVNWDGVERLPMMLFTYLGVKGKQDGSGHDDYVSEVGKRWMISAVARLFNPGCEVHTMLILEGSQGIGKSTFARMLCPDYFSNSLPKDVSSKDAARHVRDKWIIEIGELHTLRASEVEDVKQFLSKSDDQYDDKYVRREEKHPRKCVFLGTTNRSQYLKDTTGNRRFWPVLVTRLDAEALKRDRLQLWAEALHRYRAGEPWHFTAEEQSLMGQAQAEQNERMLADPWVESISANLESKASQVVSSFELARDLGFETESQVKPADHKRISEVMSQLGWSYGNFRVNGKQRRGYKCLAGGAS